MRPILLGVMAAALLIANAGAGDSANSMVPACRYWLVEIKDELRPSEIWDRGTCWGVIMTLGHVGELLRPDRRWCSPNDVSYEQMIRVVLAYIERRPQRMHEDFLVLAIEAMRQAWPCR
jgi:Rap1a immunity proteins